MDRALQDLRCAMARLPAQSAGCRGENMRKLASITHEENRRESPNDIIKPYGRLSVAEVALKYAMNELDKCARTNRLMQMPESSPPAESSSRLKSSAGDADVCEYAAKEVHEPNCRATARATPHTEAHAMQLAEHVHTPQRRSSSQRSMRVRASSTPSIGSTPLRRSRPRAESPARCSCVNCGGCRGCWRCSSTRRRRRKEEADTCHQGQSRSKIPFASQVSALPLPQANRLGRHPILVAVQPDKQARIALSEMIVEFPLPPAPTYMQLQKAVSASSVHEFLDNTTESAELSEDVASLTADIEALIEIACQASVTCPDCACLAEQLCSTATDELAFLQKSTVTELDKCRIEQIRKAVAEGLQALAFALESAKARSLENKTHVSADISRRTPSTGSTKAPDTSLSPAFSSTPSACEVQRNLGSENFFVDARDVLADVAADMQHTIRQIRLNRKRQASFRAESYSTATGCGGRAVQIHGRSLVGKRFAPVDLGAAFNEVAAVVTT